MSDTKIPIPAESIGTPVSFNDFVADHPGYCDAVALSKYTQELVDFKAACESGMYVDGAKDHVGRVVMNQVI